MTLSLSLEFVPGKAHLECILQLFKAAPRRMKQ